MNYIREINAFYDWLELNELSQSAVLLWHALMHLNNKGGWQPSFTVARSVAEAKSGLRKDAYYTARNLLKQKGLIDFKERGTKATVFTMHSFLSVKPTISQTTDPTITTTTSPTITATINKLNETINTSGSGNARENPKAFEIFESEGFGMLTQISAEKIIYMINDYSEPWVIDAMKEAVLQGKRSLAYVDGILKSWKADGRDNRGKNQHGGSRGTNKKPSITGGQTGWINRPSNVQVPEV